MRQLILLLLAVFAFTFTSCRDDFEFETSTGGLEFSRDTVYLDTVFTNIGSSTYTLKVYNRSNKDIKIPSIKLGQGEASKYRLMVDGDAYGQGATPGKIFNNVELLAKDSLFILVETTIDYAEYANSSTTFLYTDKIEFDSGPNLQDVDLVTLVQDAIFIKPNRPLPTDIRETISINGIQTSNEGHELNTLEELHWTNAKPYVVYGFALVPNGKTLTVDAGARVHFHAESGLIVDDTGVIKVNGSPSSDNEILENEVIFEGDRLEPLYNDVPGQWVGLWIISGSTDNTLNHLTVKNAVIGIRAQNILRVNENTRPRVTITNCQVYNASLYGIWGNHAFITGENIVANNAGVAALLITQGGDYDFKHCTFSNYFNSYQQVPVGILDYVDLEDPDNPGTANRYISPLNANFENSIMYGSGNIGLSFERKGDSSVVFLTRFNHCLIKLVDYSNVLDNLAFYPYQGNVPALAEYTGCIYAETSTANKPNFEDPQNNKLNIFRQTGATTPGPEGGADPVVAAAVGNDIVNNPRPLAPDTTPDIGAYESTDAPE